MLNNLPDLCIHKIVSTLLRRDTASLSLCSKGSNNYCQDRLSDLSIVYSVTNDMKKCLTLSGEAKVKQWCETCEFILMKEHIGVFKRLGASLLQTLTVRTSDCISSHKWGHHKEWGARLKNIHQQMLNSIQKSNK